MSVLANKGDTTFKARADFKVGGRPQAIEALPHGDRWSDLVVSANADQALYVMHNDRTGGFPSEALPVGRSPLGLTVTDLNGDGMPDIAVANEDDGTVSVLIAKS